MALTKEITEDRIEIVGDYKALQVRTATIIKDDGKEITRSFSRKVLDCGRVNSKDEWIDTDISGESDQVKGVAAAVWTQAVKDAWKAHLIATQPKP
jgi:hypothetical protein